MELLPIQQGYEAQDAADAESGMTRRAGGQKDALRHALWMAKMAQSQGNRYTPQIIGMVHEGIGLAKALRLSPEDRKRVWDESVMDWKNNRAGAELGATNPTLSQADLIRQLRAAPLESLPPYWKDEQPE
jgi:hypothetical protein